MQADTMSAALRTRALLLALTEHLIITAEKRSTPAERIEVAVALSEQALESATETARLIDHGCGSHQ